MMYYHFMRFIIFEIVSPTHGIVAYHLKTIFGGKKFEKCNIYKIIKINIEKVLSV